MVNNFGWCAAQANVEGWQIVSDCDWHGNRIVRRRTCVRGIAMPDGEAIALVEQKARDGSAYHQQSLSMCGVEHMDWERRGDDWIRVRRYHVRIDGSVEELPL